jgi:hypothetical protein
VANVVGFQTALDFASVSFEVASLRPGKSQIVAHIKGPVMRDVDVLCLCTLNADAVLGDFSVKKWHSGLSYSVLPP